MSPAGEATTSPDSDWQITAWKTNPQWPAALPRDKRKIVRALPLWFEQTRGLTGKPAEANPPAIRSISAWCLAVLPGALLQTKLYTPWASTRVPQSHLCGTHRSSPSLKPTATRTASSSNFDPHEALGIHHQRTEAGYAEKRQPLWAAKPIHMDVTTHTEKFYSIPVENCRILQ